MSFAMGTQFEAPGYLSVEQKLAEYEQLFKDRYTERDDGYKKALQRGSRWYQVPVMSPWPPTGWARGKRRDDRDKHRRRDYRQDEWDRRERSHYYRDRNSPLQHSGEWMPHPPHLDQWSYLPPPPHPPHPPYPHHHRPISPSYPPVHHSYPPGSRDWDRRMDIDRSATRPHDEQEQLSSSDKHTKFDSHYPSLPEKEATKTEQQSSNLLSSQYLQPLEEEVTRPPSDSDVQAILSSVSSLNNPVTSKSLKQVQKSAKRHRKSSSNTDQPSASNSSSDKKETKNSSLSMLVSHGKTESVTASLLLEGLQESGSAFYGGDPVVKKKPKAPIIIQEDGDDSDSEIDPVTVDSDTTDGQLMASTFYGAPVLPNRTLPRNSLLVRIRNSLISPHNLAAGAAGPGMTSLKEEELEGVPTNLQKKKKKSRDKKKHKKKNRKENDV